MKSMTGFGYSEYQDDKVHISLDLKSYNNRYLDLNVNIPMHLNVLEPKVREFINKRVSRGRIEVIVRMRELKEDVAVIFDEKLVKGYAEVLKGIALAAGVDPRINLSHLLRIEGLLKTDKKRDIDFLWSLIEERLNEAFLEFEASRIREGEATYKNIAEIISLMDKQRIFITGFAGEMEKKIAENLRLRFTQLLGEGYEEERVYAETAVMLVKYDINEELIRIKSHIDSFLELSALKEPVGKKLDFLCQELNREVNTIGSKSVILEVNHAVIELKDAVEKVREQLRNVE